jgi:hypothetical protein
MAKKKAARNATKAKKTSRKAKRALRKAGAAARKTTKKVVTRAAKKAKKKKTAVATAAAVKARSASKKAPKRATRRAKAVAKTAKGPVKTATATPAVAASPVTAAVKASRAPRKKSNIDRPRKTVADIHGVPSSLDAGSISSAAKSGRSELKHKIQRQTSTSPAMTAGDVDADWEAAASVGDEAPGGDNPTPDQDVVDEIGRALGVEYEDDEELQGGDEIAERDRHRWELDPNSADDFEEEN